MDTNSPAPISSYRLGDLCLVTLSEVRMGDSNAEKTRACRFRYDSEIDGADSDTILK